MGYSEADQAAFITSSYSPAAVSAWLADPAGCVLVAEDASGALIAYAHAGNNTLPLPAARAGEGELKRIYVRKDWRGSGLGTRLFEGVLSFFGPRTFWIGVWSGNLAAQRFYAKWGFRIVGSYRYIVGDCSDDERIMGR